MYGQRSLNLTNNILIKFGLPFFDKSCLWQTYHFTGNRITSFAKHNIKERILLNSQLTPNAEKDNIVVKIRIRDRVYIFVMKRVVL